MSGLEPVEPVEPAEKVVTQSVAWGLKSRAQAGSSPLWETLASTAGASTRELITRMGHSSSRAALIYQHMTSDRDRAIADRLGAMVRGGGAERCYFAWSAPMRLRTRSHS